MGARFSVVAALGAAMVVVSACRSTVIVRGGTGGTTAASTTSATQTSTGDVASSTTGPMSVVESVVAPSATTVGPSTTTGGPPVLNCNPVTNAGCGSPNECDLNVDEQGTFSGFNCFPPGQNDGKKPCDACDAQQNHFCEGTMTCLDELGFADKKCAHFCCNDADCGMGKCVTTGPNGPLFPGVPQLGICLVANGAPSCSAPLTSPSMGSCVKVM